MNKPVTVQSAASTTTQTQEEDDSTTTQKTTDVLDTQEILTDPVQDVVLDTLGAEESAKTSEDEQAKDQGPASATTSEDEQDQGKTDRVTSAAVSLKKAMQDEEQQSGGGDQTAS